MVPQFRPRAGLHLLRKLVRGGGVRAAHALAGRARETMTHEAWMKEMDAWTVEAREPTRRPTSGNHSIKIYRALNDSARPRLPKIGTRSPPPRPFATDREDRRSHRSAARPHRFANAPGPRGYPARLASRLRALASVFLFPPPTRLRHGDRAGDEKQHHAEGLDRDRHRVLRVRGEQHSVPARYLPPRRSSASKSTVSGCSSPRTRALRRTS